MEGVVVVVVGRERERVSDGGEGVGFFAVEVAVAVTGGAFEGVEGTVGSGGHELAAAVERVASDGQRVVLEALPVPSLSAVSSSGVRSRHGCRCCCFSFLLCVTRHFDRGRVGN